VSTPAGAAEAIVAKAVELDGAEATANSVPVVAAVRPNKVGKNEPAYLIALSIPEPIM
jgi:hypothetical protein